jgi:hypothetical protein
MKEQEIILTGEEIGEDFRIIEYPFNNFIVKIKVNQSNEFIGIYEIVEAKAFYNFKSEAFNRKKSDFEDFYKTEED